MRQVGKVPCPDTFDTVKTDPVLGGVFEECIGSIYSLDSF